MAAPSVDRLVESFETPRILPFDRGPTYATIHVMHEFLYLNAASLITNLGCGTLGNLCLTLYPTVYATHESSPLPIPEQRP